MTADERQRNALLGARVTVVIPVWDTYAGGQLAEAVRSVLACSFPVELIVVDNASDVALEVPPGTTVLRSPARLTLGGARNFGLQHVTSPLVVFLDADDVVLPGGLEELALRIEARPDVCVHASAIIDETTGRVHRTPRRMAARLARCPKLFALANSVWSFLPVVGGSILRTKAAIEAGGFADRDHGEDWVLAASLAWTGRVSFGRRPVMLYRWRPGSPGRASKGRIVGDRARAVRRRLQADAGNHRWRQLTIPALAVPQLVTIWLIRPAVRAGRALLEREQA